MLVLPSVQNPVATLHFTQRKSWSPHRGSQVNVLGPLHQLFPAWNILPPAPFLSPLPSNQLKSHFVKEACHDLWAHLCYPDPTYTALTFPFFSVIFSTSTLFILFIVYHLAPLSKGKVISLCIKKQRHYFETKFRLVKAMVFSCSHVWMQE